MKKYMMKKYIYGILGGILLLTSCESWLEVKMKDEILENVLFENVEGYTTALNGIYAELNSPEIYGRNLSMGAIDVMAQYYDVLSTSNHNMATYGQYDFGQESYKSLFLSVWTKMYNMLANVNLLLENCHRDNAPITGRLKDLITGEAYALRGMLHFDLLRLYGPCYNETSKATNVMPYMAASDRQIRPMLSAEKVLEMVIEDLKSACALLEKSDPVIDEGPKNETALVDLDNQMNYRQYRLNYYAVKALLARAYLWGGDQTNAAANAQDVVNVVDGEKSWFPLTTRKDVQSEKNPDRIFSTEVLFGLYNTARKNMYTSLFSKEVGVVSRLTFFGSYGEGRLNTFYKDEGDVRYALWRNEVVDTTIVLYNTQFMANDEPKNPYMIPLLSVSEMFLILAECAETDQEAQNYINKIRYVRNALDVIVKEGERDRCIAEEFARETMGKGQLYLYYKRKGMESIPDGHTKDRYMEMSLTNYVWVIPDAEIENRPTF